MPVNNTLSDFPYIFSVFDTTGEQIYSEGIFHCEIWSMNLTSVTQVDGFVGLKTTLTRHILPFCDIEKVGKYKGYFKDIPYFNNAFCYYPNDFDFNIQNKYGEVTGFIFFNIVLVKRSNTTDSSKCLLQAKLIKLYLQCQWRTTF